MKMETFTFVVATTSRCWCSGPPTSRPPRNTPGASRTRRDVIGSVRGKRRSPLRAPPENANDACQGAAVKIKIVGQQSHNPSLGSLQARLHTLWTGGRDGYRYSVIFRAECIVSRSRDPETDATRALLAKGVTGRITLLDGKTGKPRTVIDIELAASSARSNGVGMACALTR